MSGCERYMEYFEKISLLADGELPESEQADLRAHIAACPECRRVYDAFLGVSEAVSEGFVNPPETLAAGIMYKINLQKRRGEQKTPRFVWGRYTAVAAVFAVILFAASRLGLFGGGGWAGSAAPAQDQNLMMSAGAGDAESYDATGGEDGVMFSYAAPEEAQTEAPAAAAEAPEPEATGAVSDDAGKSGDVRGATAPTDLGLTFDSAVVSSAEGDLYELTSGDSLSVLAVSVLSAAGDRGAIPERDPDYTVTATDTRGGEWTYYIWTDGGALWWSDAGASEAALSPLTPDAFEALL